MLPRLRSPGSATGYYDPVTWPLSNTPQPYHIPLREQYSAFLSPASFSTHFCGHKEQPSPLCLLLAQPSSPLSPPRKCYADYFQFVLNYVSIRNCWTFLRLLDCLLRSNDTTGPIPIADIENLTVKEFIKTILEISTSRPVFLMQFFFFSFSLEISWCIFPESSALCLF